MTTPVWVAMTFACTLSFSCVSEIIWRSRSLVSRTRTVEVVASVLSRRVSSLSSARTSSHASWSVNRMESSRLGEHASLRVSS